MPRFRTDEIDNPFVTEDDGSSFDSSETVTVNTEDGVIELEGVTFDSNLSHSAWESGQSSSTSSEPIGRIEPDYEMETDAIEDLVERIHEMENPWFESHMERLHQATSPRQDTLSDEI